MTKLPAAGFALVVLSFTWILATAPHAPAQETTAQPAPAAETKPAEPAAGTASTPAMIISFVGFSRDGGDAGHGDMHARIAELGRTLPVITVLPFVLLLLCIAILPLYASH